MKRFEFYQKLYKEGLVVVVRGSDVEEGFLTAEACIKGGIKLIEVTFTVPNADELIKRLVVKYKNTDVIIGAGTVLDAETARLAIIAGAQFIVCPTVSEGAIKLCNRYAVPVSAGVLTPTEAVNALELGVEVLKLFPGDIATPKGLKAIKAPLPYANIMPTGGVSYDNMEDWFKAGAFALGAGAGITGGAAKGDYALVEATASKWVERVHGLIGGRV